MIAIDVMVTSNGSGGSSVDRSLIVIQRQVVDFCCILRTIARRVDWFLRMVHSTETCGFNFARIATKLKRELTDIQIKPLPKFHSRLTVVRRLPLDPSNRCSGVLIDFLHLVLSTETGGFNFARIATKI